MKTSRFLAIVFFLLFALPVRAETPFVIDSAWCVPNHEWLQWLATSGLVNFGVHKGFSFDFPEEIQVDKPIYGAVITDGNKVGAVLALPLKDSTRHSLSSPFSGLDFTFKFKLKTNIVIASLFSISDLQMFQRNSYLFLVSSGFTEADTLKLEVYWADLQKKFPCAYIKHCPERTLLPTLPPEQEDESAFIKFARARSANDYKDGQYVGETESWLFGIGSTEETWKVVFEHVFVDGLSTPSGKDRPFTFGGFVNPDAPASSVFRYPFAKETFEKAITTIKSGTTVIPPEERGEDGHKSAFGTAIARTHNTDIEELKSSLQDDWHIISDENFVLCYPKQAENRPEEDDLPSNAELDKFNEELARTILSYATGVRQLLVSKDWTQPLDIAISFEKNCVFLACSSPTSKPFAQTQNQPGTVTWHRTKFSLDEFIPTLPENWSTNTTAVVGYDSDKFYAAFTLELDESSEEQYEAMQQYLEQKINDTKQADAKKTAVPKTIFHSKVEGVQCRVDYENIERGFRFTGYIEPASFGNVMALARQFLQ